MVSLLSINSIVLSDIQCWRFDLLSHFFTLFAASTIHFWGTQIWLQFSFTSGGALSRRASWERIGSGMIIFLNFELIFALLNLTSRGAHSKRWSDLHSAPGLVLVLRKVVFHLVSIRMWSIWLLYCPLGDVQVYIKRSKSIFWHCIELFYILIAGVSGEQLNLNYVQLKWSSIQSDSNNSVINGSLVNEKFNTILSCNICFGNIYPRLK